MRSRLGQWCLWCAVQVLRRASEGVFVPLTVGGGIRGFTDAHGKRHSALDVAAEYFRSGADKVCSRRDNQAISLPGVRGKGLVSVENSPWMSFRLMISCRKHGSKVRFSIIFGCLVAGGFRIFLFIILAGVVAF